MVLGRALAALGALEVDYRGLAVAPDAGQAIVTSPAGAALSAAAVGTAGAAATNRAREELATLLPSTGPTPGTATAEPGQPAPVTADQVAAQLLTVRADRLAEVDTAGISPPVASALGQVAAASSSALELFGRSGLVDLLELDPDRPTPSPGGDQLAAVRALTALLSAEQAVSYGYGFAVGRLGGLPDAGPLRETALAGMQAHAARVEVLSARLRRRTAPVPAAAPAYRLPSLAPGTGGVLTLLADLESGLAGAARAAVADGAPGPDSRGAAALVLCDAAARSLRWRLVAGEEPADALVALPG